jgi:hypothetical protein
VVGLIIVLWRLRKQLAPSMWAGDRNGRFVRTACIGLILAVVFTAMVVNKFVSLADGADEDAFFAEILPFLLALDHSTFLLVVTNVVFGMLAAASVVSEMSNRIIYWGLNIGAAGFIVGLITESAPLKRTFTPILGVALLYGIYTHLRAEPRMDSVEAVV